MSTKIIAVAAVFTLLGAGACTGVSAPSTNATAAKATAAQAAPEANAAPTAANSPVPSATAETAAPAAKPVEAAPAGTAAEPASEAKPAVAEAIAPAAKPAAPAAPAAKSATLTREQALALAQKGNCLACHKIESKVVGPAWKDVAAKYRGDANAVATITSHIKSGGSFGWKFGTMPPRGGSKISDAEVASLAKFIASLK